MSSRIDFIYLNEQEMIEAGVKDMKKCIDSIEDMFVLLHKGDYRMGGENANEHGIRVSFPKTTNIEGMPTHKRISDSWLCLHIWAEDLKCLELRAMARILIMCRRVCHVLF